MRRLVEDNLVSFDLKKIALNLMYAKYQAAEGEERVAELFRYFSWDMCEGIKVEDFFIVGPEELNDIDVFMEEWISLLKKKEGDLSLIIFLMIVKRIKPNWVGAVNLKVLLFRFLFCC